MNWKPGDRAVIGYYPNMEFIGRSCEIIAVHLAPMSVVVAQGQNVQVWNPCLELKVDGMQFPAPLWPTWTRHRGYGCKPEWLRRPDSDFDESNTHDKWAMRQLQNFYRNQLETEEQ